MVELAVKWHGTNIDEVMGLLGINPPKDGIFRVEIDFETRRLWVRTAEDWVAVPVGWFLIKDSLNVYRSSRTF